MKMLSSLEPELKKIRDEKKKIQLDLDVVKKFIDEKEDKISDVKNASQAQRNKQSEVREVAETFTATIDKSNEAISDIYKNKD